MAVGNGGVFQTGRADRVVLVHDAVVEGAEPDGQVGFAEHGPFDSCIATTCLDCVLNVVEGLGDSIGAGTVADRLAGLVCVVEVFDSAESGGVDRGFQVVGPGVVGVGVALGRSVGQCPGGDVLELDAQRDLAARELIGKHRHGPPKHVGSGLPGRDRFQAGLSGRGVDVVDEGVEHLMAARDVGGFAQQRREEPVVVF